jgi:SAM-dependent methyltransferase
MNFGTNCPLCNSNRLIFNFREGNRDLYSCENCDLHFVNPYVQNEVNRNPLNSDKQFLSEKFAVNFYLPYIKNSIENKRSLLDIGCGCGELMNRCKELNIKQVEGLENDLERINFAKKNTNCLIIDKEFSAFTSDQKYDVITLINVISHIPNLNDFFLRVGNFLNSNGKLIIKTGLMMNGFKRKNGYDWQIPEHIHFFGENTSDFIPLAEELISKEYLLSPSRSSIMNFCKKFVLGIPFGPKFIKTLYTKYTKNKLFTIIMIFENKL